MVSMQYDIELVLDTLEQIRDALVTVEKKYPTSLS